MTKKEVFKERMNALKKDTNGKYSNGRFVEERLQEDGRVRIDVNVPDETELFDSLAPEGSGKLNPNVIRYIDEQAYFVPAEYDLTVNFVGREVSPQQQKQIENALHDHYNMQVYDKLDDIKNNRRLGIFLMVFGVLALAAYFFITLFAKNPVFEEVVSIVGTFSIWEAVDCWLINGHHTKVELNNALQMALIKITFQNPDQSTQEAE